MKFWTKNLNRSQPKDARRIVANQEKNLHHCWAILEIGQFFYELKNHQKWVIPTLMQNIWRDLDDRCEEKQKMLCNQRCLYQNLNNGN